MKAPLPESDLALAQMLRRHCDRQETTLAAKRTLWLLAWYYLNGYRRFNVFRPETGEIVAHQVNEDGVLEYQSQQLLADINQVAGRIAGMDLRPRVEAQGRTLGAIRNRAINQIVLDSILSDNSVDSVKEQFAWIFAALGFAGVMGHVEDHPSIGLVGDPEVVHPQELFPYPSVEKDITRARGIIRQRMVSLVELREIYGPKITRNLEDMEWFSQLHEDPWMESTGDTSSSAGWASPTRTWPNADGYSARANKPNDSVLRTVKVRELWTYGPNGTVAEYVLASGDYIIERQDLTNSEVYCPIGWARFLNNGSWHGAGMFELMYGQHRQMELMARTLFQNIQDIDKYGVLVLPQGQTNQNNVLRDIGKGLRVMYWDPDPIAEGFRPFAISPFNAGDAPGKVAAFAREGLQALNPLRDLASEKGRIDSAEGLQYLDEAMSNNLAVPTQGVARAFGDCYRAMAQRASFHLMGSDKALPVSHLTLDLAGAVVDLKKDQVSFAVNPVPSVARMRFTVRSLSPRSEVARKQEALRLWELGVEQDPLNLKLLAFKEGLDFAMYVDDEVGAYEATVRAILSLYNDGETPGELMLTPYTMNAEMVMRLLSGFLAGPHMQVASDEVIRTFYNLREFVMESLGLTLPNAVPTPEDLAVLSAMPGGVPPRLPMLGAGEQGPPAGPEGGFS